MLLPVGVVASLVVPAVSGSASATPSDQPVFSQDTPGTLAAVGTPYSYTFAASTSGGPTTSFAVENGALPPGLTLDPSTGALQGTPTTGGTYSFTVQAGAATAAPTSTVTVESSGSTAVITGGSKVQVIPAGGGTPSVVGSGSKPFGGVATDPAGDLFLTEPDAQSIIEVPATGAAAKTVATGIGASGALVVEPSGAFFVAENDTILELSASGAPVRTWGLGAVGASPVSGMSLDQSGNVFIDEPNAEEETYPYDNQSWLDELVLSSGALNRLATADPAQNWTGMAVDPAGNAFLLSTSPSQVLELPSGASSVQQYATGLTTPKDGIGVDGAGNLVVSDQGAGAVVSIAPNGTSTPLATGLTTPDGLAVWMAPAAFTADTPGGLGAVGTPYSYTYAATPAPGATAPTFTVASGNLPTGLTLDSASGKLSGTPSTAGTFTFTVSTGSSPLDATTPSTTIVVRPAITVGDVYIADRDSGRVVEEPAGGGPQITLLSGLSGVSGLDVDAAGDLYVGEPDSLQKLSVDGDPAEPIGSGWSEPIAVSVDAAGDVFAVDTVLVSGAYVSEAIEVPADGSPQHTVGSGLKRACGIATDAAGDVFVSDSRSNQVVEVPADGSPQHTVLDNLNEPCGVATDMAGDVWVAGDYDGNIIKVAPDGTVTTPVTGLEEDLDVALGASGQIYYTDVHTDSAGTAPAGGGATTPIGSGLEGPFGIAVYAPAPTFVKDTPPTSGNVGTAYAGYTYTANAVAGEADPTYRVSTGALPDGLTLSSDGQLSGTPTKDGTFTFTVQAGNYANAAQGPSTTITVSTAAAFTSDTPGLLGAVGTPYSYTYAATPADGETAPTYTAGGNLPPGLTLDPTSGKLSGTPTTGGSYTFTVSTGSGSLDATTPSTTVSIATVGTIFVPMPSLGVVDLLSPGSSTPVAVATGLDGPISVAVDASGDVFVAAGTDDTSIIEVPATGAPPFATKSSLGGYSLTHIAIDASGDIYAIAEPDNSTFPTEVVTFPVAGGDARVVATLSGDSTGGLAIDAAGDVYYADSIVSGVRRNIAIDMVPAGGGTPVAVVPSATSPLDDPDGLAVDAAGDLFIADQDGGIFELPAGGTLTTIGSKRIALGVALDAASDVFYATTAYGGGVEELVLGAGSPTTIAANVGIPYGIAVYAPAPTFANDTPATTETVGTTYPTYQYTAHSVAGEPDPTFRISSGALPDGLTLSPAGALSGVPTKSGTFTFTAQVGNAANATQGRSTTIVISPAAVATPTDVLQYSVNADRTSPADLAGSTVKGSVFVFVAVSPSDRSVVFSLDGKVFHTEGTAPFDFNGTASADGSTAYLFDTTTLSDGPHTISAVVTDAKGGVTSASSSFTVANGTTAPPQVLQVSVNATRTPSSNLDGAKLAGNAYIFANVPPTDRQVMFSLDGSPFHTEGSAPFDFNGTTAADGSTAYPFPTATLTTGSHTVSETAVDSTGVATSTSATFSVTNGTAAPSGPTSPLQVSTHSDRSAPVNLDGSTLTGTAYIFDTQTLPVTSVQFTLDGKAYHFEGTAPYDFNGTADAVNAIPYMLSGLSKGTHTITAAVTFTTGKTETDSGTFTVS